MIMKRELCHLWGPFSIYSYGVALALGIFVFTLLCLRDPRRKKLISTDQFIQTVIISLVVGLIGARLLFILNSWSELKDWTDLFAVWSGGLSILGGIIAILLIMPWYLRSMHVPVLPLLDIAALYAPLLHAIARLGCWMAGCCYGKPTTIPWAIIYTDPGSDAPLGIPLHPTQLYTSLALLVIFLFFYFFLQKRLQRAGQLLMAYLMAESVVRFGIDYVRNDIEYFSWDCRHIFSAHQWLALGMFVTSLVGLCILRKPRS